eukprot:COSAG01_NODE_40840_length_459_cov_0.605556_1_plen_24_part_01
MVSVIEELSARGRIGFAANTIASN